MRWSRCLSFCFCISSWGIFVRSLPTLPHVTDYQVVTPRILKVQSQGSSSQQTYPDVVQYSVALDGQNYTLHLEKNRDLVGKHYALTHYSEDGAEVVTTPDHEDHCYYHGHVVDMEDSSVSVGLCSGIQGFVHVAQQSYLIEPLGDHVTGKQSKGEEPHAEGEELHAVYRQEHLRRKRSSCSYDNITVYDHGSLPSGMYHLGSLRSEAQTKAQTGARRVVEMVIVVDHTEYKKFGDRKLVEARMLQVANHVDKLYRSVGLRVMLVGLQMWSYRDLMEVSSDPNKTLTRFLQWRQDSLLNKIKHDNAQFVTGVDFQGSTVGLAPTKSMCSIISGAVNEDHNQNPVGVASTIAHELGHNLGMSHDETHCLCGSSASAKGCIMAETVGFVYPKGFSSCSRQKLSTFLEEENPLCLLDSPSVDRIYGGPVCGNAYVEPGEECDCGTVEECMNSCCNASTCRLNAGAQCAEGDCCHDCQLRPTGSVCRARSGDCDLAEHCTGFSPLCPVDSYTQNGLPCNRGNGYCHNGECPTHTQHCKRLWGPDAEVADNACFLSPNKQCRKSLYGPQRCPPQEMWCGKLYCTGGRMFPVTRHKYIHTLNGVKCNEASMDATYSSEDITMVPTGTKCGTNMVCYDQRCQDIKVYGTDDCSAKCNDRGVCNHEKQCHCDPGWAPPYCNVKLSEQAASGMKTVIISVSLAGVLLLLLILVFGGLRFRRNCRKEHSSKGPLRSTSGQSNPLFQSGSPRQGPPRISQPTFVESSATQANAPLSLTVGRAPCKFLAVTVVPSRPAPEPPRKTPSVLPPRHKTEQVARPCLPPPIVPVKNVVEPKPKPPSRPLPPLSPRSVTKPKPPIPSVKPVVIPSPWKQNQLAAGKAALKPPTRPR
ncbi:disintegrin and metalloproteinase domain-containing protein 8a isoform X2 [Osmerus mordax]|uniref:disintegrin and metalloproteinase domain-containing protein 8a isoform X2 n=1 Tax=Osmerus mordax TaxID=8014 RepID=UPI0035103C4B